MNGTPLFRAIEKQVIELRPSLVVVDNVAAIFAGNQNDRVMVRTFVNLFRGMARASGAAVQLLNHPSLSGITNGTGRGGNMDWRNSVRAALHLKSADDRDDAARGVRVLECVKNNYAPLGAPTRLEWVDGVLMVEGTASPHQRAAQDTAAEVQFLAHLASQSRLGRDVSDKTGKNFAPAIFATLEPPGGYTSTAFRRAMERLFRDGKIVLEAFGPRSKDKKRLALATGGEEQ
jgi:RecA-family ATPase